MVLRNIKAGFFIVVFLSSLVHNLKIKRETSDFTDILKNISSVNHLLQSVIKNYKKLEKIAISDTEETLDRSDAEIKKFFDVETSKGGRLKEKTTTKSDQSVRTPIFFSDESWREGESISIEEDSVNGKENYDGVSTESKEFTKTAVTNSRVKFIQERESNGDDNSSEERFNHRVKKHRNPGHQKHFVVMKIPSGKQNEFNGHTFKSKPIYNPVKTMIAQSQKVLNSNSDDEKVIRNEVLRADYLRQAYSDACKTVIIRKCRRALRAVSKDVCSRGRKCTRQFKDDFRQNGMSACDLQFTNQTTACRSRVDFDDTEALSPIVRRLHAIINSKETENANSSKHAKLEKIQEMNILRDRYEKACKKDSNKKCLAACSYSYRKTCKNFKCVAEKSKLFKKSCKRRCKESFGVSGGSGDDSSSANSS